MINGSSERTCQANGTWSGEAPYCQGQNPNPSVPNASQNMARVPKYRARAKIRADEDFKNEIKQILNNAEQETVKAIMCFYEDVESPSFGLTCPRNIRKYADWARNYTTITWPPVIASDNSGEAPNVISVGVTGIYYRGKHQVFYNATDQAGNYKICTFFITVEVLRCQTLLPPLNGFFMGDCVSTYGSTCRMSCNDGYQLLGSGNVTCLNKPGHIIGYWDKPSPICRDVTSPIFLSCPSDISVSLGVNSTVMVNWTEPVAWDNSNLMPNVTVNPPGIRPPHRFNETTFVVYTAVDGSGNKKQCSFKVIVVDELSPEVVYCPKDQIIITKEIKEVVIWNEPQFKDNSNHPPTIKCNHQSGTEFYWGTWNVSCTARDNNPNNKPALCQFNITVKPQSCSGMTPPQNGAKGCDKWMFGRMCSPMCKDRWDFPQKPRASVWVCAYSSGIWYPSDRWPDCSEIYRAGSARMAMHLHYFTGDCNTPEAKAEIAQNFIQILNTSAFKDICQKPPYKDKCKTENVEVTCADDGFTLNRGKRNIFMYAVFGAVNGVHHERQRRFASRVLITADIVVSLDGIQANNTKEGQIMVGEIGIEITKNISRQLKSAVNNDSLVLRINGTDIKPDKQSLNISEPKRVCNRGQVYKEGYCLNCTFGTYLNYTTETCEDCPIGTYQDYEGQERCLACPAKTSTTESRTGNRSKCLALCKAGSFSPTGLEPCFVCDKGLYQEMEGERHCLKCGVNETTPSEGSNNSMQCGVPCSPGSFSSTGLTPCTSCDRRSFQPLSESRACFSCPGTTVTKDPGSRSSQDCIEINECDSSPCKNNSTCTDLIGDFLCSCQPGYTGKECDTNIDECQDQPCFNNGTCHDFINNYSCSCAQGYQGFNCDGDIDECISSPCPLNATCINLPGSYKCECEPGYKGSLCDEDIDECLTFPCQNGATCKDKINYYECLCALGFQGNDCEENINDCMNISCQNGGICRDGIDSYHCVCPAGFNGTDCEYNIDECVGADCQNNATCIDKVNGFLCFCKKGFSGQSCEIDIDECLSHPCKNQATCLDMFNGYHCKCPDGFDGLHCENNIDDCATNPCSNNGSCTDGANSFSCVCPPGFSGKSCNVDIDLCASMPCLNNGSCFDSITSFTCECTDGFDGEQCQTNADDCEKSTCMNNSTCIDGIAEFRCACAEGFAGANCEINIDECEQNPCLNDGICTDMTDDYRCTCARGYTGKNCSVSIDECSVSPCYNNATCVDRVDNYTCVCLEGFSGRQCEFDIDDCLINPCSNRSTCKDGMNSYTCHCEPGFTGLTCDIEIDECASFPCYYGGTCFDRANGFTCVCPAGFTGGQCEVNINDCASHPCVNNGTCLDLVANYSCLCLDGFSGSHCEKRVDYCRESNCTVNGYCVNSRTEYHCNCSAGYYGKYCEFETDECRTEPCFNNATCQNTKNNFTCSCLDGFTGKYCEVDFDDCMENTCLNNATCIDEISGYSCDCSAGYNGTNCQTEINECESNPCSNNGTCIDLTPGYNCTCADKFYGESCENLIDVCQSAPCQHGGTCNSDNSTGNFICSCSSGFTGTACEVDIDDCTPDPCTANAFCIDLVNNFRCECSPSYAGDHCEILLGSNFDLVFKRQSSKDMVFLSDGKNIPSMIGFTIAQFVRADSRYKSGTLFSYSVPENPEDIIVLSFVESQIILEVKDEKIRADFRLADDNWHFVGVTWNASLGRATVYIDGMEIKKASKVKTENIIRGGGWIVLGQRHLAEEKIAALSSAFVGILHQVSIWNAAATRDHMWNAAHNCSWPIAGSLRAWKSFLPGIKGQVQKRFITQCKALEMCTTNCSHFQHCESRDGFYYCSCQAGFTGAHCNININDCSPKSCLNGKCVDGINRFECVCNNGYYGISCEKKIISEEDCPDLKQPTNGKSSCRKFSGQRLCILSCNEGFSFSKGTITHYTCGPESEWKWNGRKEVQVPTCLRKAPPKEIVHEYLLQFPRMQCSSQNHNELRTAIKSEIRDTLVTVAGCQTCQLQKIKVPECNISANKAKRAAEPVMEVIVSLNISKAANTYEYEVEERSEEVLFLMKSAVATGQFVINLNGINMTAVRSSFQVLRSIVICRAGFLKSSDGKECVACFVGTFHDQGSSGCKPCDKGTYQDKEGQSVCKACGEGKSTLNIGASSSKDCFSDGESVKIHVIASVIACVAVGIILGVIIAYKRLCKSNEAIDSSTSPGDLPLQQRESVVEAVNNSAEKYQLCNEAPDEFPNTTADPDTIYAMGDQHASL
ncbi:Fibropellin-1 [Stylophora pistillata]|uniref:Fibropellin-1 n=1 Tax=Stylophora pistillata TaxID=50429 RepID=A0A2B4S3E6_STYPI|nr:Fibropellin-1 [Stylophora pistillata]